MKSPRRRKLTEFVIHHILSHEDGDELEPGEILVTKQTGPEGRLVRRVLIEEALPIERELYLGIVLERFPRLEDFVDESIYSDPNRKDELTQLIREQAAVKSSIEELEGEWLDASEALEVWMREVYDGLTSFDVDAAPEPLDEESAAALRSLGYVD